MVSGFSSQKFGFGLEMDKKYLKQINEGGKNKNYVDAEAATYLNGSAAKP